MPLPAPHTDQPALLPTPLKGTGDPVFTGAVPGPWQKAMLLVGTVGPLLAFAVAIAQLWNDAVGWTEVSLMLGMYFFTALGVTVGYHRMVTHRAFEAKPAFKLAILGLGGMALEGGPIEWASNHRVHHAHSDGPGDPHSPHHGFEPTLRGQLRGLWHSHMGWMFTYERPDQERFTRDLRADPVVMLADRLKPLWMTLSMAIPTTLGWALAGGTTSGAVLGLLWGGLARVFLNHQFTFCVNSICHVFGSRPFANDDLSANNWVLAIPSLGESWHHNHHAFPASAEHGLTRWQVDISALVIRGAERLGWVWDVRRVTTAQQERKRARASASG